MKKTLLFCLLITGIIHAEAQTRIIVRRPAGRVVVAPARAVIVSPGRPVKPAVVVRPAVTVIRPVARRRIVVVHR